MEDNLKKMKNEDLKKIVDNLKTWKTWKTTSKEIKMEDNLKTNKKHHPPHKLSDTSSEGIKLIVSMQP
jgi:type I restriction-modification system DNA methylase subunit